MPEVTPLSMTSLHLNTTVPVTAGSDPLCHGDPGQLHALPGLPPHAEPKPWLPSAPGLVARGGPLRLPVLKTVSHFALAGLPLTSCVCSWQGP